MDNIGCSVEQFGKIVLPGILYQRCLGSNGVRSAGLDQTTDSYPRLLAYRYCQYKINDQRILLQRVGPGAHPHLCSSFQRNAVLLIYVKAAIYDHSGAS